MTKIEMYVWGIVVYIITRACLIKSDLDAVCGGHHASELVSRGAVAVVVFTLSSSQR